jgi:N-acyl-D-aspartate/D-glutamate deacylase
MVLQVIEDGFPQEKLPALNWAMEQETLSNEEKSVIAQKALSEGLTQLSDQEKQKQLRELRYEAARRLTELGRSEASSLVIEHFDRTNVEVDRDIASKSNLLEAIACVGAMGTREAAVRLSLYLEVLNTYKENGQKVDEQVALAVIKNLGILGDEVAFDHLLYTMYLDYPRSVKQAAREVLSEFKE